MTVVKPFRGLRPPKELIEKLSCLPYDVMNSQEAAQMAEGKPESLLHVTRAEIDCPAGTDLHSETVYKKAVDNFKDFQKNKWLIQDDVPHFYIYAQTMNGRTQYGIVGAAACEDYQKGVIKKNELTRPDKEEDRMVLTNCLNANVEPVFFSYRSEPELDEIVSSIVKMQEPDYDFVAEDGFGHHFWTILDAGLNKKIETIFAEKVESVYVADGHHRTAAAARIGLERKTNNPDHTGKEPYNFFMTVLFPDNQLKIIDYNRLLKDLNGNCAEEILEKLGTSFSVKKVGKRIYKPSKLHEFSMYIDGNWYCLNAKPEVCQKKDPVGVLDVTILSEHVLTPLFDIKDLRTSKRIDFVGGIRGLGELQRRVDSGEMKAAFALYPVSMKQLINIADSGKIMPPKTTWFEPKLRSGLVIHKLD
ncbi:MAG: DUF1015 domain-containing protein [Prolixibacteraceae bacterium]|nr:DUF1015 domain-containing protein [Prolixibacteraceae bacterium]